MTSVFAILRNYTVKQDVLKKATKGTENKGYHELLFHAFDYNLFFDIDKVPKDGENQNFII